MNIKKRLSKRARNAVKAARLAPLEEQAEQRPAPQNLIPSSDAHLADANHAKPFNFDDAVEETAPKTASLSVAIVILSGAIIFVLFITYLIALEPTTPAK